MPRLFPAFRRVCDIALAVGGPHNLDVRFGPQQKCLHGGLILLRSQNLGFVPLDVVYDIFMLLSYCALEILPDK